jgi:two-component system copper resistance phosphate regulon response regulator CusR
MRILLVEDDEDVARFIRRGLAEGAYAVDVVTTGAAALEQAAMAPYDAIVLDLMIPAPDGMEVCRALRAAGSEVPILMLTARGGVEQRIAGLDAGADDYLAKPFAFGELLARLRALLRRPRAALAPLLRVGGLEIDTRSHAVRAGGEALALTTKEYGVLEYLARNSGRIVTREELAEHVWNEEFDPFTNLIEVYINRLRRHLDRAAAAKLIHTVRGAGYILEPR